MLPSLRLALLLCISSWTGIPSQIAQISRISSNLFRKRNRIDLWTKCTLFGSKSCISRSYRAVWIECGFEEISICLSGFEEISACLSSFLANSMTGQQITVNQSIWTVLSIVRWVLVLALFSCLSYGFYAFKPDIVDRSNLSDFVELDPGWDAWKFYHT